MKMDNTFLQDAGEDCLKCELDQGLVNYLVDFFSNSSIKGLNNPRSSYWKKLDLVKPSIKVFVNMEKYKFFLFFSFLINKTCITIQKPNYRAKYI